MAPAPLRDSLTDAASIPGGTTAALIPSILLVDDDPQMIATLVCYFEPRGFKVSAAATLREAQTLFRQRTAWTLVMSDFHLPDGNGAAFCEWIRAERTAPPPFLLMSGSGEPDALQPGMDYLSKPFAFSELESRVSVLLGRK